MRERTLLILSQVYVPDPAAVGQHMADAAAAMRARGYRVRVLTSGRGYEDPARRYPAREVVDGVEVRRLPLSSFGKASIVARLLGGGLFMLQCIARGLFTRRLAGILVSTSPPMCAAAALPISLLRRVPIIYWVMDLNPDQMIELGKIGARSRAARAYDAFNRTVLGRAREVVALDRFMAARLLKKRDVSAKLSVLPPWPHEERLGVLPHEGNPFREEHGLEGKFVFMYSGNHGFSTPVTTVLRAALRFRDRSDLVFMFIGGGVGKREVERAISEQRPANIVSLPYQPLDRIRYSLSAADVHVVTIADRLVGVVHPCKAYGAMAVARPILLVGPDPCHVSDLVREHRIGWRIANDDLEGAVRTIERIAATPRAELHEMGLRARAAVSSGLSKGALCGAFCDVVERGLGRAKAGAPAVQPAGVA